MDEQKEKKEGISVKELEEFTKKYRYEVFLVAVFVLSGIFGLLGIFWAQFFGVLLAAIGAIIGALLPEKVSKLLQSVVGFVLRQDKTTQLIISGVALVLSMLAWPLVFLLIGLHAGKSLYTMSS